MNHCPPTHRRIRRRAGLTLLELVLALAGTALVGTAVTAMLHAAAYGSSSGTHLRDLIPAHRVPAARIRDLLQTCEQVFAVSPTQLIIWYDDRNDSGAAGSIEMAWLRYDADSQTLKFEKARETLTATVPVTPASDFSFIRWGLSFIGQLDAQNWAENVTACTFTADVAAPDTQLITWRITVSVGGKTETQVHAAHVGIHQ